MTVHNLSDSSPLTTDVITVLNKGLSFSLTPKYTTEDHLTLLQQYNHFSNTIRKACNPKTTLQYDHTPSNDITTPFIYRKMKFIKNNTTVKEPYSIPFIETYIYNTKDDLNEQLPILFETNSKNITSKENKALNNLRKSAQLIVKPADKNLGIVIMNTQDYLEQMPDASVIHYLSINGQLPHHPST